MPVDCKCSAVLTLSGLQLTAVAMFPQAAQQFAEGVKQIDGLEVVGQPDMCLGSTSKKVDIYKVKDLMSQQGWRLNALQFPSIVCMCFTAQHTAAVPELLKVAVLALAPNALQNFALLMSHTNICTWPGIGIHQW